MARRRRTDDSSLELLLDTICNTFGGILFLAILVSLLLRMTRDRAEAEFESSGPMPAMTRAELIRKESELRDAEARIGQLKNAIALAAEVTGALATPEVLEAIARRDSESARVLTLQQREGDMLGRLVGHQTATVEARAAVVERKQAAAEAEVQLSQAKLDRASADHEAENLRAREVLMADVSSKASEVEASGAAPKERSTGKSEWPLLLRYGRVYQLYRESATGRVINTEHFDVEGGVLIDSAHARVGAGVSTLQPDLVRGLTPLLKGHPPDTCYVAIIVFPDSFDGFQRVKSLLVGLGYEYRTLATDTPLVEGDVTEVKVQ